MLYLHLLRRVPAIFRVNVPEKGTSPTRSSLALIGVDIVRREARCIRASLTDEAVLSHCQQISLCLYAIVHSPASVPGPAAPEESQSFANQR